MKLKPAILACLGSLMCLGIGVASAETGTVSATIPWEAKGRVFRIGPETLIFLGAMKGIAYATRDDGVLNEGFMLCPVTQRLNASTQTTSAVGQCEILVAGDDVIYAEFVCEGKVGRCEGEFRVTGGGGRFEGVTGSSKMSVRSPIHVLAPDVASGSELRISMGLAELAELKYRIPE